MAIAIPHLNFVFLLRLQPGDPIAKAASEAWAGAFQLEGRHSLLTVVEFAVQSPPDSVLVKDAIGGMRGQERDFQRMVQLLFLAQISRWRRG